MNKPVHPLRKVARLTRQVRQALAHEYRRSWFGTKFPAAPSTLNLLVNDICNSKCQMCLIWQRKQDNEITPANLATILKDPLFSHLNYIGVSGGEPTLRKDLPELFQVITEKRPAVHATGIITNAINAKDVIARIQRSAEICQQAGVKFNVMVSLDGIGAIHDQIRGRKGNFDSALQVIQHFQTQVDIPVLFGCTITKDNVWHVDELLDFAIDNNLYGRFRVAEFINRLYNGSQTSFIRNFTAQEAYHLALFFTRLERGYESNPLYQRTYRNIRTMLLGEKRQIGCPYQTSAAVLDSRGQLLYCAPKSPILGNTLENSAQDLYRGNLPIRQQIIRQDCQDCIHDYHADPLLPELNARLTRSLWRSRLRLPNRVTPPPNNTRHSTRPITHRSALIVGWYGTETAGDKAILGELLYQLKSAGVEQITLASLFPFLSKWTVVELGHPDVQVIDTYSAELLTKARESDETIMGGGPLMDLEALGPVYHAFRIANAAHRITRIAGCGIGPLHKPRYIEFVKALLSMASSVELRDSTSVRWATDATQRHDIQLTGDPAIGYVTRWKSLQVQPRISSNTLNLYLREWTSEYAHGLTSEEFRRKKDAIENALGVWINQICTNYKLQPRLLPMHHFHIGGDDRIFNRRFAGKYLAHLDPLVEIKPLSVPELLTSMLSARYNLTMRFHSTLFAYTLGIPFTAIDYTGGGKVKAFLADQSALNHYLSLEDLLSAQTPVVLDIS